MIAASSTPDTPALPPRIAGRPVVRLLAAGSRADLVLLGSEATEPTDALVARVWRGLPREDVDREIAALTRVEHPHVIRVLDLETLPDGGVAVLEPRLTGPTITELLVRRRSFSVGEAITLAAPVVDALGVLHAAGVAHGRVDARRIRLDGQGAPVLLGFGRARLFARDLPPVRRVEHVSGDLAGLRVLIAILLDRVDVGVAARERIRAALDAADPELLPVLTDALFSVASPAPVRVESPAERPGGSTPGRIPISDPMRRPRVRDRPSRVDLLRGAFRSWEEGSAWVVVRRRALEGWRRAGRGMRLALVASAAGAVAVGTAVALVPDGGAGAESRGPTRSSAARSTATPAPQPSARATTLSAVAATVRGDDPLAAAAVLLPARESALRDQDADALTGIDESGSPAEQADRRVAADGGTAVVPSAPYTLAGSLGQAALVESGDAHVLLVRTRAGWRIRDVSASDPGRAG